MLWLQNRLGVRGLAWVFLLPNLVIFGMFTYLPLGLNFVYSLTGTDAILLQDRSFVGVENYQTLLNCENYLEPSSCHRDRFWIAVYNTISFVVLQVGIMVALSLLTAVVLNRKIFARGFFRSVFFFPVLLSPVVVALIWEWIILRQGLLNAVIEQLGGEPVVWLVDRQWAFFWCVFITVWAQMGFFTLILLAGLQTIPLNIYEAAKIDGTSEWRMFRRITLPLLMPTLSVVVVLSLIRSVQVFDEIYVLTGGGPGSATTMLLQYIFDTGIATKPQLFGLAAAASLLMGAVLLVLTLVQLRLTRNRAAL